MERLIKNGNIILDGTLTRYQKEKQAFEKLEKLEHILEKYCIDNLEDLEIRLSNDLKQFTQMGYGSRTWEDYHNIEGKLGIDLTTLFKLINAKNVYSYGHTSIMKNTGQVDIYDRTITIWNGSCHQVYPLSEYGKSFALTKEELEHGQSNNQE